MRYDQLSKIIAMYQEENPDWPKTILEVGTWNGDRAIQLQQVAPNAEYFGFDLWEDTTQEIKSDELDNKPTQKSKEVIDKLHKAGVHARLFKGDTKFTLPAFAEEFAGKIDFIFIDGGHSIETIESDFHWARQLCSDDGIIVLDDFYLNAPEVITDKYGCNNIIKKYDYRLLKQCDRLSLDYPNTLVAMVMYVPTVFTKDEENG